MTIAGSDNSGGAGIQADLKTFMAHGCYGLSAIAAITAQNNRQFKMFEAVSPELIYEQIKTAVEQSKPQSTKTGMLATHKNIEAVCRAIKEFDLQKIVIDPVLKSSTGNDLTTNDYAAYMATLKNQLIPPAFAITPNKMEAELLTGIIIESYDDAQKAAKRIYEMGVQNVIIKGGHLDFDQNESIDILYNGKTFTRFTAKKINEKLNTGSFHGTGCTFSAALCAYLALGFEIEKAAERAKKYTLQAMKDRLPDAPPGLLNHDFKS